MRRRKHRADEQHARLHIISDACAFPYGAGVILERLDCLDIFDAHSPKLLDLLTEALRLWQGSQIIAC